MFDHLSLQCRDVRAAADFYQAVLAPLGYRRVLDIGWGVGFGIAPRPTLFLGPLEFPDRHEPASQPPHIGFSAPDRASVDAFHQAAIDLGAEILHGPRLWHYYPDYYAAHVRDLDGLNIEAVSNVRG